MNKAEILLFLDYFVLRFTNVYSNSDLILFYDICLSCLVDFRSDLDFISDCKLNFMCSDIRYCKIGHRFLKFLKRRIDILNK